MTQSNSVLSYTDAALLVAGCADELRAWGGDHSRTQSIPLQHALGRVLAATVVADRDQPPFRRATRDGFACRAEDAAGPLRVVGQIRAGDAGALASPAVERGEAVEIMTGAPVPEGADCVVMVEHVHHEAGFVRLDAARSIATGENIVPAGAEALQGAVVLPAGLRLAANHIGAAAACGYAHVAVHARPIVAVIATGDEIVELDQPPLPFQIRNSNSYSLAAQVQQAGAEPLRLPVAPDDPVLIEARIQGALQSADLLILSGGVSAGRYDFVEAALLAMGAEFLFTGVLMQPGRPVVFGRLPRAPGQFPRYFFGLPGNPVSTLVTCALFVQPIIDALGGASAGAPRFVLARLGTDLNVKPGLTRFLPALLRNRPPFETEVFPIAWQGSGDLANTAKANCFVVVPSACGVISAGETVSVLLSEA